MLFKGAMYHRIGDWYPQEDSNAIYGQIYTIDSFEQQLERRTNIMDDVNQELLHKLQVFFVNKIRNIIV